MITLCIDHNKKNKNAENKRAHNIPFKIFCRVILACCLLFLLGIIVTPKIRAQRCDKGTVLLSHCLYSDDNRPAYVFLHFYFNTSLFYGLFIFQPEKKFYSPAQFCECRFVNYDEPPVSTH